MRAERRWVGAGLLALMVLIGSGFRGQPAAAQAPAAKEAPGARAPGAAKGPAQPLGTVTLLAADFEQVVVSQAGFYPSTVLCVPGGCGWAVAPGGHSGLHAAAAPDVAGPSDQRLVLGAPWALPAGMSAGTLSYYQRYDFATAGTSTRDGGVIEVSTDNGASWTDASPNLMAGPYNGLIAAGWGNPLDTRPAWVGTTNGQWQQVQLNLAPYAGQALLVRFRLGSTDAGGTGSWAIDDLQASYVAPVPCGPAAWAPAAPLPTARWGAAVVGFGDAVYSFGGATNVQATADARRYDPATNGWTARAPLPDVRVRAAAVSDGTYIYILNGEASVGTPVASLIRFDPATNSYALLTPPPLATRSAGAVYLDGKIYRIGGNVSGGQPTATVDVFTIATGTWAAGPALPGPTAGLVALAHDGAIDVAGGVDSTLFPVATTYRLDPGAGTWSDAAIADLPAPLAAAAGAFYNGRWVVAGGYNLIRTGSLLAWDPAANQWSSLAALPDNVQDAGAGVAGDAFYVVGGATDVLGVTSVAAYYETACPNPTPTPGPSPSPCALTFSDVPANAYFYPAVTALACQGVISGYGDGTFRPYANTTRGQLAKIVVLGLAVPPHDPPAGQYTFADVPPSQPFFSVIEAAAGAGIVSGYACGGPGEPCDAGSRPYFRPGANVTRGQLAKIVAGAAGWPLSNPAAGTFADVAPGSAFYPFVETAVAHGIISGYACGGPGEPCDAQQRPYFRQGNPATRGQIAKIVYGALTAP